MYCTQIYFGHGVYGVEAASQLYFRKHLKDLQLEEAALIAGIIQENVRQSPYVDPEAESGAVTTRSIEWLPRKYGAGLPSPDGSPATQSASPWPRSLRRR